MWLISHNDLFHMYSLHNLMLDPKKPSISLCRTTPPWMVQGRKPQNQLDRLDSLPVCFFPAHALSTKKSRRHKNATHFRWYVKPPAQNKRGFRKNAKPRTLIAASRPRCICFGTGEYLLFVLFSWCLWKVAHVRIMFIKPGQDFQFWFCTQPSSSRSVSYQCRVFYF